LQDSLF